MTKEDFSQLRKQLEKTQKELAALLGISIKTIHSYEQGWRSVPSHIERQLYFLIIHQRGNPKEFTPCWEKKNCLLKENCPAWEFQSGHLCWFLCGTLCDCAQETNVKNKLEICKKCDLFKTLTASDKH